MYDPVRLSAAVLLLASGPAAAAASGPAPASQPVRALTAAEEARVVRLIEQMGEDSYRRRQAAYEVLCRMGPEILPVLRRYRKHPDVEIVARVESVISAVGWTLRGAVVLGTVAGTQARKLGLRPGDVVVKMDDKDVTGSAELAEMDHSRQRTCYVWRDGRLFTRRAEPGKIGIYIRDWQVGTGEDLARGLSAAIDGRFEEAYRRLLKSEPLWRDEPHTLRRMIGIAEYNLDHRRAMRLYQTLRGLGGPQDLLDYPTWSHRFPDRDYGGLPISSAHTAWLLERKGDGPLGPELYEELTDWAIDGGRNAPLARQLLSGPAPEVRSRAGLFWRNYTRIKLAFHDRRWEEVLRLYPTVSPLSAYPAREAVVAAVSAGELEAAASAARRLFEAYARGDVGNHDAAYGMVAVLGAIAAGRKDLAGPLLDGLLAGLSPAGRADMLQEDVHFLYGHMAVNERMAQYLGRLLSDPGTPATLRYVYLDTLRFARSTTLADWRRAMARYGGDVGGWNTRWVHWMHAETLLRFGRYAEARAAVKKFFPEYWGLEAFHAAVKFLSANAGRLAGDWAAIKGTVQVFDAREKSARWAVRYDGRTFYVDPAGKVQEPPGLAPGEIHRSASGGLIASFPTGTVYCRLGQVYLLDEQARRWVRTYAAACRGASARGKFDDATAPVVLRYVLAQYPVTGPGREIKFRELAPGGWRLYHFNGDLVVAVQFGSQKVIDLGRQIARQAGRAKRVDVYRIWVRGPKPLIPTSAGLWTMEPDGALSRVKLGRQDPNVIVSVLSWPKREGRKYIGVAPQHGGEVYELDLKTWRVSKTRGYCGVGPADSHHWFMHDRRDKRIVPGEYALQALYEKRLAAGKK